MSSTSPFLTPEHETFREQMRRFVEKEVTPHINEWDEAEAFPRELYRKAGQAGILGIGYPERYGGTEVPDLFYTVVMIEELARAGSGGILAGLYSHGIALPPIVAAGTDEQKARLLPDVLRGEKIAALAITEPGGGSDVANLQTTARLDGDAYVVNGSKAFITSGVRADLLTVGVRTGGDGMGGVSVLVIDGNADGVERLPLKKMGWWCSDTALIHFRDVRVPVENRIGDENQGFASIMHNFNGERIALAAQAHGLAEVCYEDALNWARERKTFGRRLTGHQVIRHKLVDMRMRIDAVKAHLDVLTWRVSQGHMPIAEVCMLKNHATLMLEYVAGEAVQILGGMGYMRETRVERIFRETKVLSIGGGAVEIMKDLASRQLGY